MATKMVGEGQSVSFVQLKRVGRSKFMIHSQVHIDKETTPDWRVVVAADIRSMRVSLGIGGINADS